MFHYPEKKLLPKWVTEGIERDTITWAESFAKYLVSKNLIDAKGEKVLKKNAGGKEYEVTVEPLTTSQIRRFFGEVKRISNSDNIFQEKDSILMLKPQLAYAVGRAKSREDKIKDFYEQLSIALDTIRLDNDENCEKDFRNFVKIYEAIIAYHKANNGK
ncbi:MAG: type III-A CRISPR-associated protein Csm2 [Chitinophagales bacterium]|nr:type III-A CRISPR-associated protein Csm2 [Chitinophagales bacterium]